RGVDRDGLRRSGRDHHTGRLGRDDFARERGRDTRLERPRPGDRSGDCRRAGFTAPRVPRDRARAARVDEGDARGGVLPTHARPGSAPVTVLSEWTKLRTQRGALIAVGAMCFVMVALTALAASESHTDASVFGGDDDVVQIGLAGVVFAALAAVVAG